MKPSLHIPEGSTECPHLQLNPADSKWTLVSFTVTQTSWLEKRVWLWWMWSEPMLPGDSLVSEDV